MPPPDDLEFGQTIRGFVEGQKVFDRYILRKILGRGGMGIVWLAWDEKLEEEIALKFMPEMVRLDDAGVRELKRETRKSLKLTHPHIVRIRDFVEDAHSAAIAMEYVDGPTFSALRFEQPGDVFAPEQLSEYLQHLVSALTYAHELEGVVHRDIKPANLMVNSRGHLKVADFGISGSVSDSMSRVSMAAGSSGSPPYMSPQQVMGEPTKPTDDIYSLGATIYELLTGKPPFYRGNIHAQIRETVPPLMSERRAELGVETAGEIPAVWDAVVARCLAKDPAERPQSAQQLLDWLEGREEIPALVAEEVPPQPLEPPAVIEERPEIPRSSRNLVIAGVILGLLLLAAAGTWWFGVESPRREREKVIALQAQKAEAAKLAEAQKIEKERKLEEARKIEAAQKLKEEQKLAEQRKLEEAQKAEEERKAAEEKEAARLAYREMDQVEIERLAEKGDAEAQFVLGYRLVYGDPSRGVRRDEPAAELWFEKAIAQGHSLAAIELAAILNDSQAAGDKDRAAKLARDHLHANLDLAKRGDPIAQLYVGYSYDNGIGVEKDYVEAVKWFRLAVDQGSSRAQSELGYMYACGQGVEKDYVEAIKLFRLAVDQGDSAAQNNLAFLYFGGEGVEKDYAEAARLLRLAADQGLRNAQNSLGYMYLNGFGVEEDLSKAIKWFRLAAKQGHEGSKKKLKELGVE